MFEDLFFIYLNCFLTTIFVRIIIFILSYYACPFRICILVFLNLSCPHIPPYRISVVISVSVLLRRYNVGMSTQSSRGNGDYQRA